MWDHSFRFGFGPRAPTLDEEAALPLLAGEDCARVQYGDDTPPGPTAIAESDYKQSHADSRTTMKSPVQPCKPSPEQLTDSKNSQNRPEHQSPDLLLAPILTLLERLESTTPTSLPPYNPRIRTKTHAQILKGRLLPIGDFIVTIVLAWEPQAIRGKLELELCRHIAIRYWPLAVTDFTHLYIMEMYRNAQYEVAMSLSA